MQEESGVWRGRFVSAALIPVILILDQLSKWWIVEKVIGPMAGREAVTPFLPWLTQSGERLGYQEIYVAPFFNLVMVWNQGISFGLFNGQSDIGPLLLTGLALVLSAIFAVWLFRSRSLMQMLAIALVIGGALGNVIDRLRFGAVIDFLDVHAFGYHWPAFNVADSCVVVGVLTLIVYSVFFEDHSQ